MGGVTARALFPIMVLGPVLVRYPDARTTGRPPSAGDQYVLAALVAGGAEGITLAQLDSVRPTSGNVDVRALRMSLSRLRQHLPEGAVPEATDGRYRLARPVIEVDAWRLAALADDRALVASDAELRHLLRPVEPYQGLRSSDLVEASIAQIRADQQRLLLRLGRERPEALRGPLLDLLPAHLELDPYHEELLETVVEHLSAAGRRREALSLMARARREFVDAGLTLGRGLDGLEQALLEGDRGRVPPGRAARRHTAAALAQHLGRPLAGGDEGLLRLDEHCPPLGDRRPVVVTGEPGAGKTRLLAEAAQRAHDHDVHVSYLAPATAGMDAAFGPVVAAMPSIGDAARAVLDSDVDHETRRARLWGLANDALVADAAGLASLLLVDDAQWLDSHTAELVLHLCHTPPVDLTVVVAGRVDEIGADTWHHLRHALARQGAREIEVAPLAPDGIRDLIRNARPDLSELQVASLADRVFAASGGVPGVATVVIDALGEDPFLHAAEDLGADVPALDAVVARLPPDAREIGVVAAVLGLRCDLQDLAAVAQVPDEDVLSALDPLIRQRLVVERTAVEFTLAHVLVQAALLRAASKSRIAELHRRAARRFADDAHRSARHLAASAPLPGSEAAGRALVRSAILHLGTGRHREAAADFEFAQRLGEPLAPGELAAWARALDLVGSTASAAEVRARAIDAALAAGDDALALRCAVSGLPEAEPIDGDRLVVANLLRLDPTRMARQDRWLHAVHTARQLAIVGGTTEAVDHAERAAALAVTPLERVRTGLVRRFVTSATTAPSERLARLAAIRDDIDAADVALRAELLVLTAVDSYEGLDVEAAARAVDDLESLGASLPSVRAWHATMLRAMFATDAGDVAAADAWRRRALDVAQRTGVREGHNAFVGAAFVDAWRDGTLALLLEATGRTAGPSATAVADRTVLAMAAGAAVLEALGDREGARRVATELAEMVLRAPAAQGTSALALVSSILARGEPALAERVRALFARRGRSMLVIGAGAASLGPAPRYVAMLGTDGAARREALLAAQEVAAACGARVWQPVLEHDLATWAAVDV